ncbi:hypothetical protein [Luteolibacter sp. AS25]|uniref:hypothetical protein n=1 Tax=Luteolibacter sp. AS25 TaxID=3135776 RepID=UPI00398B3B55
MEPNIELIGSVDHTGLGLPFERPEGPTMEVVGTIASTRDSQRVFHKKSWYDRTDYHAEFAFDLRGLLTSTRPDLADKINRSWIQFDHLVLDPTAFGSFGSLPAQWFVHVTTTSSFDSGNPLFPTQGRNAGEQSILVRLENIDGTKSARLPPEFLSNALRNGAEALWIRIAVESYPSLPGSGTGVQVPDGWTRNKRTRSASAWMRRDQLEANGSWQFLSFHSVRPQLGVRYLDGFR